MNVKLLDITHKFCDEMDTHICHSSALCMSCGICKKFFGFNLQVSLQKIIQSLIFLRKWFSTYCTLDSEAILAVNPSLAVSCVLVPPQDVPPPHLPLLLPAAAAECPAHGRRHLVSLSPRSYGVWLCHGRGAGEGRGCGGG